MMSAGSAADGSPRAALNAASCRANDLVGLKNRNGFSTSQIRSAAAAEWMARLELAARPANRVATHAVASARRRIRPSPTPSGRYNSQASNGGERSLPRVNRVWMRRPASELPYWNPSRIYASPGTVARSPALLPRAALGQIYVFAQP